MSSRTSSLVLRPIFGAALICAAMQLPLAAQSGSDADFVKKASSGGMAEVKLGQLAQQKASSPAVKQFGKQMETDHSKANEELQAATSSSGMTASTSLDAKNQALYDKLSGLSGSQFDHAYMQAMIKDHKEDIAEFQKEAKTGHDPKIKAFAAKTVPTLKEHLTMAESAARQTGGGS
jgi:putative membrane protein